LFSRHYPLKKNFSELKAAQRWLGRSQRLSRR